MNKPLRNKMSTIQAVKLFFHQSTIQARMMTPNYRIKTLRSTSRMIFPIRKITPNNKMRSVRKSVSTEQSIFVVIVYLLFEIRRFILNRSLFII